MEVELSKNQEKMTMMSGKIIRIYVTKIFKARYRDYAENHTPQ
jgi:hypothetical protein